MFDVAKFADEADMIVNGYAFRRPAGTKVGGIVVVNLNNPAKAVCFSLDGDVLETTMDDIELNIVKTYLAKNIDMMEG